MVIELFHFRGLFSYGVRLDYFNEPRSLFAGREGDGRMKDKDHHIRHPRGHFGDRASAQGTRGCAWRDDQFGRGQNIWTRAKHRVGLERPHFCTRFRAQSDSWVAPAQSVERGISLRRVLPTCPARIRTEQVKRVRITFFSFVFTRLFTL